MKLLLVAALLCAVICTILADIQTVKVKGQVVCDKRAFRNVRVELREHDTFDPDDSLRVTRSDDNGYFTLTGQEVELRKIQPYIRITHNCDVRDKPTCKRVSDYEIPSDKVSSGETFDMGFVNLNLRANKDTETCDD
ncbi:transthyretin-like protein 2 precursor [Aphelenchoides avenae]|nr:transthyretin-like protein 2 precursor [Aphelenchus avenae]